MMALSQRHERQLGSTHAYQCIGTSSQTPFIFLVDHASNAIPKVYRSLGLDGAPLRQHIAWDIGALDVAKGLAQGFSSILLHTCYSRLLVDVNRCPDTDSAMPAVSDEIAIPGNQDLTPEQRQERMARYFWPYHKAIEEQINERVSRLGQAVVIAIHSFTPAMRDGVQRPWHIGILWNEIDGRIAVPLMQKLRANAEVCVGENQPYHANTPDAYTMKTHAEDRGQPHVLIEIRQDLISNSSGVEKWSAILERALAEVFAEQGFI